MNHIKKKVREKIDNFMFIYDAFYIFKYKLNWSCMTDTKYKTEQYLLLISVCKTMCIYHKTINTSTRNEMQFQKIIGFILKL